MGSDWTQKQRKVAKGNHQKTLSNDKHLEERRKEEVDGGIRGPGWDVLHQQQESLWGSERNIRDQKEDERRRRSIMKDGSADIFRSS